MHIGWLKTADGLNVKAFQVYEQAGRVNSKVTTRLVCVRWYPLHPDRGAVWTGQPTCCLHDRRDRELAVQLCRGPLVSVHTGELQSSFLPVYNPVTHSCIFLHFANDSCKFVLDHSNVFFISLSKHRQTNVPLLHLPSCPSLMLQVQGLVCFHSIQSHLRSHIRTS